MTDEPVGNWLWQAMDDADKDALRPFVEFCHLPRGDTLMRAGDAVDVVYFPVSAVIGNLIRFADGGSAQAASVGRNGVTGLAAFLAEEALRWEVCVQLGGDAWRLPAKILRERCQQSDTLFALLMSLTHQNQADASLNAACHLRHHLIPRLARWLLTTQDRTAQSELTVTQSDVADWLGVTRTSIVAAFNQLAAAGGIKQGRAKVTIVNRALLKSLACECYARP